MHTRLSLPDRPLERLDFDRQFGTVQDVGDFLGPDPALRFSAFHELANGTAVTCGTGSHAGVVPRSHFDGARPIVAVVWAVPCPSAVTSMVAS